MIRAFVERNKLILGLIAIFILAEIIVNPIGDFPLNDDWSYAKSVKFYLETNHIDIGSLSATTLWTQIVWGGIFTKLFGFSFTVMRFSTLISALIGILLLNKLIINISGNKLAAVTACAVLLFNPIYFNLSNTFMTDVNFVTLLITCIYFAFSFFDSQKPLYLLGFFCFATLTVLLRQLGVVVPVCFLMACLFLKDKKWLYVSIALVMVVGVYVILKYYEGYLKTILPPGSSYQFSGNNDVGSDNFWNSISERLWPRLRYTFVVSLVYPFPFVMLLMRGIVSNFKRLTVISVFSGAIILCYFVFKDCPFLCGNIFGNASVGPETFYQTFFPYYQNTDVHCFSPFLARVIPIIEIIFSAGTLTCIIFWTIDFFKQNGMRIPNKKVVFLMCLFGAYTCTLLVTFTLFDRYELPNILFSILLIAFMAVGYEAKFKYAFLPLLLSFYVSVFGTKDYLEVNRIKWKAYHHIINELRVDHSLINGGYEVNSWYEGKQTGWLYFTDLYVYEYLIQYRPEPRFIKVKEFEFQRYFPYKKDKISIFKNLRRRKPSG